MTMSSSVSKVILNGDGVQTAFPFSFKVWKAADLEISITNADGDVSVVSNWAVVLAGQGGTVTYPTTGDPLPSGHKITVRRSMDFLQDVDLVSGTRWDPEVVETVLDQATAERQQLKEEVDRALKLDVSDTTSPAALLDSIFEARDTAVDNAASALDSAERAEIAASTVAYYNHEGTLSEGEDTIALPWAYDTSVGVEVFLAGVKQTESSLEFIDTYTVKLDTPVSTDTSFEVVASAGATSELGNVLSAAGGSASVGFLQSGTGADGRTVQDKLRDVVSVKDFGANGDGVTDDTAAIQAAIDSGAKEIIFPSGTYSIGSYIDVDGVTDLTIRGVGSPVLFQPSGKSDTSAFNVSFFRFKNCTNVFISGLKVDGNRDAYAAPGEVATNYDNYRVFWIVGCTNLVVENCIFENWPGVVIKVVGYGALGGSTISQIRFDAATPGCDGLKIIANVFDYCAYACQLNPCTNKNVYVQNNTFNDITFSAVSIYPHAYNVFVQNNTMKDIGRYAVRLYENANGEVSGNYVDTCNYGIVLLYGAVDFVSTNINILNNVIIDPVLYGESTSGAICVTGDNLQIEGNVIGETSTTAKYIAIELEGKNISFVDNVINYSPSGAGQSFRIGYDSLHGSPTYSCENINITNNRIAVTSGAYGILLNPSATITEVYIGQNKITGQAGSEVYDPNKKVIYEITGSKDSAEPSSGTWKRGDIVFNSTPTAGGFAGWICVSAGTPGTWKTFGTISA